MDNDIVIVSLDSWRYDAVEHMPDFSTYAQENGYSQTDMVCQAASTWFALPSIHASLYSSQAYNECGNLTERVQTLANVLSNAGYTTGGFIGANPYANLWKDGFDELWNSGLTSNDKTLFSGLSDKYNLYWLKYLFLRERTSISDVTKRALKWYNSKSKPRFLWVHIMDTHEPYLPGLRAGLDIGLIDIYRAFYQHMKRRDALSDELLQTHRNLYNKTLERLQQPLINFLEKLDDKATVIVTSDHGQEIERGWHAHARMYDEVLRVPFFCRWTLDQSIVYPEGPVRQIDLAPTLVNGVRASPPSEWEGKPIDGTNRESFSIGDYNYFDYAYAGLRTNDRKIIKTFDYTSHELAKTEYYNLTKDPNETENRYPDGEQCRQLESRLTDFLNRDDIRLDIYSYPPSSSGETAAVRSRLRELGYID